MNLLHIDSSIKGAGSISRELGRLIVAHVVQHQPSVAVTYRDLAAAPLPHLSPEHLAAAANHGPDTAPHPDLAASHAALQEFIAADVVLIDAPMYNFAVPSQLKSWFDRILIAGKTFRYTASGAEGLMAGKRAIVASSRGNIYAEGTRFADLDHHERWLHTVLAFMGINDVQLVRAEGLALSPEHQEAALTAAKSQIEQLRL